MQPEFFNSLGDVIFEENAFFIFRYPFEPSVAFGRDTFIARELKDVDIKAYPPNIHIGDELIFIHAGKREELEKFANRNGIQIVQRPVIWDWILEPFLDTEFTKETEIQFFKNLAEFGLSEEDVNGIRSEVSEQMIKYNFDSMLWEWASLGALDVLNAIRPIYNEVQFDAFYKRVMQIALRDKVDAERQLFKVRIYDNFHYMDEEEAYDHGSFNSYKEALEAAKKIVREFLVNTWTKGMTLDELITQYTMFGEDPIILPDPFYEPTWSARDYAHEMAEVIYNEMRKLD